jgi:hypothetical protein
MTTKTTSKREKLLRAKVRKESRTADIDASMNAIHHGSPKTAYGWGLPLSGFVCAGVRRPEVDASCVVDKRIFVMFCSVRLRTQSRSMAIALRMDGMPQAHAAVFRLSRQKHATTEQKGGSGQGYLQLCEELCRVNNTSNRRCARKRA